MKRVFVVAVCIVLAAACSKRSNESPASSPASQPVAASPAAPARPAAQRSEPKKVEITEDLVTRYLEYEKENFALVTQFTEETRKNLQSAKGDAAKMISEISTNENLAKEMDAKLSAKRQSLGIGDREFEAVKDAAGMIANGRVVYGQMGGDAQLARMEAEQKKQLAALPPDQRPAASAEMEKMVQSIKDMRDGADLRKTYGDKSADAVMKHADALAKQRMEALELISGKK